MILGTNRQLGGGGCEICQFVWRGRCIICGSAAPHAKVRPLIVTLLLLKWYYMFTAIAYVDYMFWKFTGKHMF